MSLEDQMFQLYGPILVVALILVLRWRSLSKERVLDPARLWIVPALFALLAVVMLAMAPPGLAGMSIAAIAFAAGIGAGWQRGKLIRIAHDPATGRLLQKASPAAIVLLLTILLARFAIRQYAALDPSADQAFEQPALIVADALLMFAVGLVAGTRIELTMRARRILSGEGRDTR